MRKTIKELFLLVEIPKVIHDTPAGEMQEQNNYVETYQVRKRNMALKA